MIPGLDVVGLAARDSEALLRLREAATEIGFLTLENAALNAADVGAVLAAYRRFFTASEVINFAEMLEMWTGGQVRATPHRAIGTALDRISVRPGLSR